MMTKEEIEKIEARLKVATPGPWRVADREPHPDFGEETLIERDVEEPSFTNLIIGTLWFDELHLACTNENAQFIAHAPTDIANLLAEVKRLQKIEKAALAVTHNVSHDPLCPAEGSLSDCGCDCGMADLREACEYYGKTMQTMALNDIKSKGPISPAELEAHAPPKYRRLYREAIQRLINDGLVIVNNDLRLDVKKDQK